MAKKKSSKGSQAKKRSYSPGSGSRKIAVTKEFNPDYSYVIQDLKRIGVLAMAFVVILVALSLIIN